MITVVGGGPAGCYTAYLLARAGQRVRVLEEHKEIGNPVQCTGIVTQAILKYIKPHAVVNRVSKAELHSQHKKLAVKLAKPNLVLNRAALDKQIATMAQKAGAEVLLSTKAKSILPKHKGYSIETNKGRMITDIIVGADGPLSMVASELGLHKSTVFFKTKQGIYQRKNQNIVEFYLLEGGFGWVVPEGPEIVRAGIATLNEPFKAYKIFSNRLKLNNCLRYQGGLIPMFSLIGKRQQSSAFLVGDAAGFVKATTGGGIVQALESARCCTNSILHGSLLPCTKLISELTLHRIAYSLLHRHSQDELIGMLSQPTTRRVLEQSSRDSFIRMAFKLAIAQPMLMKFLYRKSL